MSESHLFSVVLMVHLLCMITTWQGSKCSWKLLVHMKVNIVAQAPSLRMAPGDDSWLLSEAVQNNFQTQPIQEDPWIRKRIGASWRHGYESHSFITYAKRSVSFFFINI